jgi:hypothetical protein
MPAKPEFSEEEEQAIKIRSESIYRAQKRLQEDSRKEKCEGGEHSYKEGKCRFCGATEPAPEPRKQGVGWKPY